MSCSRCYLRVPGKLGEGVGVRNEGKAAAAAHNVLDVCVEIVGEASEDGEDGDAGEQRGEGVREADDPRVPEGSSTSRQLEEALILGEYHSLTLPSFPKEIANKIGSVKEGKRGEDRREEGSERY